VSILIKGQSINQSIISRLLDSFCVYFAYLLGVRVCCLILVDDVLLVNDYHSLLLWVLFCLVSVKLGCFSFVFVLVTLVVLVFVSFMVHHL